MNHRRWLWLPVLCLAQPLAAQRLLDFTGKPLAVAREPLSHVSGARELSGNRVVVTDQVDHSVWLVTFPAGTSRRVGREGSGPGEYRFPMAPLRGPGDSTWIVDPSLRRLLLLSPDGSIPSSLPLPPAGSAGLATARGTDRSGWVYFEENGFDQTTGRFNDTVAVVRWNPGTGRIETLTRVWGGGRVRVNRPDGPASMARGITPFPHLDAWTVLPGGEVAIVHHDPFRIDIVEPGGKLTRGAVIDFKSLPVTASERDAWRAGNGARRVSAVRQGGGSGPQMPAPQFSDEDFPKTMPPFIGSSVIASPEGEIWVGRSHGSSDKTWQYDVFDRAGGLVARATLRAGATVVGFGVGTIYIARKDPADDLVYLEQHRRH